MKKVLLVGAIVLLFGGIATAQIVNGPVLGSVTASVADTGTSQFVTITLSPTGVADLNAALGGQIIFGGAVSNATLGSPEVDFFGYNGGIPVAFLELNGNSSVNATGEGWCSNSDGCDNTIPSAISNVFAGEEEGGDYQDWFAFTLPNTSITSASINIWNDGQNYTLNNAAVYSLYEANTISYGTQVTAPEPCSLTLLGMGLLGLAGIGRRKLMS